MQSAPPTHACSEKIATDSLKVSAWGLEQAIDHFYTSGLATQAGAGGADLRAIEALWQKYKGTKTGFSEPCLLNGAPTLRPGP